MNKQSLDESKRITPRSLLKTSFDREYLMMGELRLQKWTEFFSAIRGVKNTMSQVAFTVKIGGEA